MAPRDRKQALQPVWQSFTNLTMSYPPGWPGTYSRAPDLRDPPASASLSAEIQDMYYMCGSLFFLNDRIYRTRFLVYGHRALSAV